jgi:carbonic anhydrase
MKRFTITLLSPDLSFSLPLVSIQSRTLTGYMKKSIFLSILGFLYLTGCNSNGHDGSKPADSLEGEHNAKDSAQVEIMQAIGKDTDNIVKVESPDAMIKYEQGYALPKMHDGMTQSPVDIISYSVQNDLTHRLIVKLSGSIDAVENLGHTVQVDFAPGSAILINGNVYNLKQLHFHTPSEHLIDGMTYPMEMHIVGKANDSIKLAIPEYTVVGVLFRIGHENKFIREFLDAIPKSEGKNTLDSQHVHIADLFMDSPKSDMNSYFNYQGSLTTPPYTESVNWVLQRRIFEASEEQIRAIEKLEGNNARHVRALNGRKIAGY